MVLPFEPELCWCHAHAAAFTKVKSLLVLVLGLVLFLGGFLLSMRRVRKENLEAMSVM